MNSFDFSGRVALVTGGGSGIGIATAGRLRDSGAQVACLDLNVTAVPNGMLAIEADVTSSSALNDVVAQVEAELGGLDVLVCSAGVAGDSLRTVDVTDDEWRRVFAVNSDGVFYAIRAALPGMLARGYGRIVSVASIAGKEGNPMAAAYSASKAAVIGMTKSIGKDVAATGVLVNCVAPAVIDTPLLGQVTGEHISYMVSRVPLGRLGQPEEVAHLICFLASEEMAFATGATFDLSGGRAVY